MEPQVRNSKVTWLYSGESSSGEDSADTNARYKLNYHVVKDGDLFVSKTKKVRYFSPWTGSSGEYHQGRHFGTPKGSSHPSINIRQAANWRSFQATTLKDAIMHRVEISPEKFPYVFFVPSVISKPTTSQPRNPSQWCARPQQIITDKIDVMASVIDSTSPGIISDTSPRSTRTHSMLPMITWNSLDYLAVI